jgi:phosphatidyl-myo-inositol dimannoside synthase
MRILVVSHYYPEHRGGIEIIAGELAARLARRGAEVVWAASASEGSGPEGVRRRPVAAWNVAERRLGFPYPLWGPLGLGRLASEVARCDVVHLHDSLYAGNAAAFAWAKLLRKPVVVTQHVGEVPYARRVLRCTQAAANRTLARLVLAGADRVVYYSPKVRDYFAGLFRLVRPPAFIPNGVDTSTFHPVSAEERRLLRAELGWPSDRPVLLFVGRFVEKKGLGMLHALAKYVGGCEWVFAGWGPEDPGRWGLPHVRVAGALPRHEVARHYQAADLLVLPSVGEGFPLVVQEAMACGLPAVISRDTLAGAPEVGSLLYSLDLDEGEWVTLLRLLVRYPGGPEARRGPVAEHARRHWDWEECADRYLALFREVLGRRTFSAGLRKAASGPAHRPTT